MVSKAVPIETDTLDSDVEGLLREDVADGLGRLLVARLGQLIPQGFHLRAGRYERHTGGIVDDLRVDVPIRAINRQARPLLSAQDFLSYMMPAPQRRSLVFYHLHNADFFTLCPA